MSTELHSAIAKSKENEGELWRLMNSREGGWGLVNGQLVQFVGDKVRKFERMTFDINGRKRGRR